MSYPVAATTRTHRYLLAVLLVLLSLVPTGACRRGSGEARGEVADLGALAAVPASTHAPVIAPHDRDEASDRLDSAGAALARGERARAAAELRRAADAMRATAADAGVRGATVLHAAGRDLDTLATRVDRDGATSVATVDSALARAHQGLAEHHYLRAAAAWTRRENIRAGEELDRAAAGLDRAGAALHRGLGEGARTAVRDARRVGGRLVEGVGYAPEEVGAALAALGREIERAGRAVGGRA